MQCLQQEAWKFYNLKLRLAVGSVLVPSQDCTHQVIEAGIPEIGHDVMAPPKCVQLILLHGGLNLEADFQIKVTHIYKNVKDDSTK